ncbi:serine/threonine-protein kinase [Streptomyces sp. NPDC052101]|uniref:serine/threonine-protein kinase n=1 Tax=Streptomyces sp. NPDC052101 TaxID=3155763 RepID=UPI003418F2A8
MVSSGEQGPAEYGNPHGAGRLLAGRYRVTARLGRGGMGVVWRAVDEVLGREVAVKELRTYTDAAGPELSGLRLRMRREARAAARVRHPGVVAVHDVAEADGRPLIVMELIDGPSLDGILRERGPLDPYEAARIGVAVTDALAAAHHVGVLHRDVKPGNILLDRTGRVVLTDFGIATMDDPGDGSATRLTRSGELVGSLDYLAPERAQGGEPGAPADVWALGATLYAAVEGASPFRRTSTYSTLTAIVAEPLPEPRRAGPLAPVLRRLMDKRPDARPDAEEARDALRAVAQASIPDTPTTTLRPTPPRAPEATDRTTPSALPAAGPAEPEATRPAVPTGPMETPSGSPRRKGRALLAAAAVAVVLAAAGITVALMRDQTPKPDSASAARPSSPASASAPAEPAHSTTGTGGGEGHTASPAGACRSIGGGRSDCQLWRTATTYTASGAAAGTLSEGLNYFYCQADLGRRETYGRWTNVWWAKTDDDSGNTGVYVSDVYLKGGDNDAPVPGLPVC